jgi:uncharacterized protein
MKYLLVLAVVLVGIWAWRRGRDDDRKAKLAAAKRDAIAPQEDMVRCAHCGLHLPRSDALPGGAGDPPALYCSAEHRARSETP